MPAAGRAARGGPLMAAPRSRRLRNQRAPVTHSRRDIVIAAAGSAAVLAASAILIWAMRPGGTGNLTAGKGGILHRQPKVALWLLATAAAIGIIAWLVLQRDSKVRKPKQALLLGIGGVVVVAAVVMGVWHDSLVHDYTVPTVPTVPPTVPPLTTTAPGATTTAPGASTTSPGTTSPAPTTTGG